MPLKWSLRRASRRGVGVDAADRGYLPFSLANSAGASGAAVKKLTTGHVCR